MDKRHIWRYPSRAQKRNRRFLFRTVGHRHDIQYLALRSEKRTERIWIYKLKLWLWKTYFIYTKLLVIKHILKTHIWASQCNATLLLLYAQRANIDLYNYRWLYIKTYFIYTTLLVIKHIFNTQTWAAGHTVPVVTFWETHSEYKVYK